MIAQNMRVLQWSTELVVWVWLDVVNHPLLAFIPVIYGYYSDLKTCVYTILENLLNTKFVIVLCLCKLS